MLSCTPKATKTFNEDAYDNGMTYRQGKRYNYIIENNKYKVYLGKGYLYFDKDEFNKYFSM